MSIYNKSKYYKNYNYYARNYRDNSGDVNAGHIITVSSYNEILNNNRLGRYYLDTTDATDQNNIRNVGFYDKVNSTTILFNGNIYNVDGKLLSDRTIDLNHKLLTFNGGDDMVYPTVEVVSNNINGGQFRVTSKDVIGEFYASKWDIGMYEGSTDSTPWSFDVNTKVLAFGRIGVGAPQYRTDIRVLKRLQDYDGNIGTDGQMLFPKIVNGAVVGVEWRTPVDNSTEVIDNLTSTDTDKALSAKQGKKLQDTKVDKVQSTDNAITRFSGVNGEVQDSGVLIDDNGTIIINPNKTAIFRNLGYYTYKPDTINSGDIFFNRGNLYYNTGKFINELGATGVAATSKKRSLTGLSSDATLWNNFNTDFDVFINPLLYGEDSLIKIGFQYGNKLKDRGFLNVHDDMYSGALFSFMGESISRPRHQLFLDQTGQLFTRGFNLYGGKPWKKYIAETNWVAVTNMQNSWINFGGIDQPLQYKIQGKTVSIRGTIKSGTTNSLIFSLPAYLKPLKRQQLIALADGSSIREIFISDTGNVQMIGAAPTSKLAINVQFDIN